MVATQATHGVLQRATLTTVQTAEKEKMQALERRTRLMQTSAATTEKIRHLEAEAEKQQVLIVKQEEEASRMRTELAKAEGESKKAKKQEFHRLQERLQSSHAVLESQQQAKKKQTEMLQQVGGSSLSALCSRTR